MADTCPNCGLPHGATGWEIDVCKGNTITRLREQLATTKAQLDRAQLLLIKSRDALDLAIGEMQQRPESEEASDG